MDAPIVATIYGPKGRIHINHRAHNPESITLVLNSALAVTSRRTPQTSLVHSSSEETGLKLGTSACSRRMTQAQAKPLLEHCLNVLDHLLLQQPMLASMRHALSAPHNAGHMVSTSQPQSLTLTQIVKPDSNCPALNPSPNLPSSNVPARLQTRMAIRSTSCGTRTRRRRRRSTTGTARAASTSAAAAASSGRPWPCTAPC